MSNPTLADALKPGLTSEERAELISEYANYVSVHASYPRTQWKIKELVQLLDAHARDARRKALADAIEIVFNEQGHGKRAGLSTENVVNNIGLLIANLRDKGDLNNATSPGGDRATPE